MSLFGATSSDFGKLLILSPYWCDQNLFANPALESFSDVVIPFTSDGSSSPSSLALHRCILSRTSPVLASILQGRQTVFVGCKLQDNKICGLFDGLDSDGRSALLGWLRFCYGFNWNVSPSQAPAVLAMMLRLQIVGKEEWRPKLEAFMITVAARNCESGIEMLQKCQQYPECRTDGISRIDKSLAKCVFTQANFATHPDSVKACLMGLPLGYLKEVQFGPQGTASSEYALLKQYLERNKSAMTNTQKKDLLTPCNFQVMAFKEVDELVEMCQLNDTEKMELFRSAFASCRGESCIKETCLSSLPYLALFQCNV